MANVVVVGSQWGDEGKGKIVDWLSERADIVVRFQGGHNAGHTLVIDGVSYKLSLLPSGRGAAGQAVDHRQRRRRRSVGLRRRDRAPARAGRRGHAGEPRARRERRADPVAPPRARRRARERRTRRRRSARPGAASARPTRTRSAGARSASSTSPTRRRCRRKIDRLLAHHNALRRGLGAARSTPRRCLRELDGDRAADPALRRLGLAAARRGAPRRPAHPVRGRAGRAPRRRPRHLSLRHLVEHGRRPGGGRLRPRPGRHRLCARHHQGLHDAGRRGAVPDRGQGRGRRVVSAGAARNSARSPGASAAAAGSTRRWSARPSGSPASTASR